MKMERLTKDYAQKWDTIKVILVMASEKGWKIHQLDVKSAFLHGELPEIVYVDQPQGYQKKGEAAKVYKLKRTLYGLK